MDRVDDELAAVAAILVTDRTLRGIIKRHRRLPGLGLQVPHAHCHALPSAELAQLVAAGELGVDLAGLPAQVVVISGDRDQLAAGAPDALTRAWRTIFHARIHLVFDDLLARRVLTAAMIRERVHRIGRTEFHEVRFVLRQEELLLPPFDDTSAYVEFIALYLELRHFAPRVLEQTFPTLHGAARVDAIIALDVDVPTVLAAARPARAVAQPIEAVMPEVDVPADAAPPPPRWGGRLARRAADRARQQGNRARAAIMAARAGELDVARADLDELVARLARALGGAPTAGWAEALLPVARFAASQRVLRFTAGARLLHDLQAAGLVAERELKVVDAVAWALSRGRQPIVRALPATREVRVARHLRGAAKKIASCELASRPEREALAAAVHAMVAHANHNVRTVLRPKIEEALDADELRPRHLPERVAQKKIVDELLDHAVAVGSLSIGNLRDAIAHNDLKLPDLRPIQLVVGDQLLRADHMLARSLDGVYRRGEIYLRVLQKISSVLSGTGPGRLLSLYVLLPIVGAFFVVEGLQHIVGPIVERSGHVAPEIATTPAFVGVGVIVFLLLHASWFRRATQVGVRVLGRGLRVAFVAVPRRLWRVPLVRPFTRWLLLPAVPAALAVAVLGGLPRWVVAAGLFALTALVINASVVEEMISDWLLRSGRQLARRILPGLIRYALDLFSRLIELLERGIYRIDELLRFRPRQSKLVVIVKGVLGTLWFAVSYLLRLYVNLFIEPTVNPIKHFPVVTVAAKLILPFTPQMISAIAEPTGNLVGPTLGASLGAFTVLVLPGLAGFLAWELNGNWQLYGGNRAKLLRGVSIGSHGETMVGFIKPGFHSGTIPKLHAKLRRATWKGDERGVARYLEGLHHVEEAIWKFTDRQLVSMLNESLSFRADDVAVHDVDIGSNRLRLDLVCPSVATTIATISFEQQAGWLVAGIPQSGWIDGLDDKQRRIFEIALAGFYKLSGVDLVREQIEDILKSDGLSVPPYDIADEGLVVWPGPGFDTEIIYDLGSPHLAAALRGAAFTGPVPVLAGRSALFGREPVRWSTWATTWQHLAFGMEPKPVLVGPGLLPARTRSAQAPERAARSVPSSVAGHG